MLIKIYLITNKINQKKYIGITSRTLKKRWREHCYESGQSIITKAILKYKENNFSIKTLKCVKSIERALNIEAKYIKQYNTLIPNGYNVVEYGRGITPGLKKTEQHKIKLSKSKIELWKNPEYRKEREKEIKERWKNPKRRKQQSKKSKKLWEDKEYAKKTIKGMKKIWTPEKRQKHSEILKKASELHNIKKRLTKIMKVLRDDPEWKKKQKEGVEKSWENPTRSITMSKAIKQSWAKDPERKKILSNRLKSLWKNPKHKKYRQKQIEYLRQNNLKLMKSVRINDNTYKSMSEAAKSLGVSVAAISASIKRKRKGYSLV